MADKKRYTVTIDMYVNVENDYMARRKAHNIKRAIENDTTEVIEITETPFASFQTRKLEDISDISYKKDQEELPF